MGIRFIFDVEAKAGSNGKMVYFERRSNGRRCKPAQKNSLISNEEAMGATAKVEEQTRERQARGNPRKPAKEANPRKMAHFQPFLTPTFETV